MSLLERINKENDIKKIESKWMPVLAEEIRYFLVDKVSETGGHLASNLGTVEVTMALHRCLDLPKDKIIFDVGHQSYTHKILTGRKNEFYKLRKFEGLSGFPKAAESDTDAFDTGHSSTSISAAVGMAEAAELLHSDERICAVIGDGSMTGGMVYEALDQMSQLKRGCLIVLNDNEMSISPNVGGMHNNLSKFRIGKPYNELKSSVEKTLLSIPDVGVKVAKGIKRSKDSVKNLIVPGNLFSEMGITYIGPIDGHDVNVMTQVFEDAFELNKPVIVHVKTKKGKGYGMAERYPEYFHGVGAFDKRTGRALKAKSAESYTDVFSKAIVDVGHRNDKVVTISAAMIKGTGLRKFQNEFPDRIFDVGIAEQHAVTSAAGMAKMGLIPVVCIYSSFMQRAYDQLLHDVCLQKLHVVFCIDRSGIVGEDGDTHMGIYDTSYLRSLPGMTILAPKGGAELVDALDYAINECDSPVCIKYPKGKAYTEFDDKKVKIVKGRSEVINFEKNIGDKPSKSLAIIAVGSMVETAVKVRDKFEIETEYTPELINLRFIKPLDEERIRETFNKFDVVAVIEESVRRGSVGEEIAYLLSQEKCKALSSPINKCDEIRECGCNGQCQCVLKHFCIKDETVEQGSVAKLREIEGLGFDYIYDELSKLIINL